MSSLIHLGYILATILNILSKFTQYVEYLQNIIKPFKNEEQSDDVCTEITLVSLCAKLWILWK